MAPRASVLALLDRYAAGQFDEVVADLAGDLDFGDLLTQLKRDGPGWIDAAGPDSRARRELVAITLALEAARADAWYAWKLIWLPPPMTGAPLALPGATVRSEFVSPASGGAYQPFTILRWQPGPLFVEWACERLRREATPRYIERWWQLAALAVAQRSEDNHFLVGDPNVGRGVGFGEIGNVQDEIRHLDHVTARFPDEPRFMLAQGSARAGPWPEEAVRAFTAVGDDPDVGGEATMRLGVLRMRHGRLNDALDRFDRVEALTRDPYVIYLARLFKGQTLEQQRRRDQAMAAYRGAVAAWPHAQSATLSLAGLLFDTGRRADAHELVGAMLAATPPATDPWRAFVHADDRFWPLLVGRLRAEIRP